MLLAEEIAEEYPVHGKSVLTPSGMKRVKTVYKTVPLSVWVLCTTGHMLRCSGHHLVKLLGYCERVQNLHPGEWVDTESGYEKVISVSQTGDLEEMYDVTVESEDGLFYSSGVCSHNSTTFAARQLINGSLFPGYKSMYVVPFPDHMKTYARRFQEMEMAFRGNTGKQNMYNKVYSNGSAVDIIYTLTTADKSRGKTEDEVLIDECVVGSTELYSAQRGVIRIDSCLEGEVIRSFDEHKNITYDVITRKKNNGLRPCWCVQTASGREITCTANHRFRSPDGWFYLADILDSRAAAIDRTVSVIRDRPSLSDDESSPARLHVRYASGRRLYSKTGTTMVHPEVYYKSRKCTNRVLSRKRSYVVASRNDSRPGCQSWIRNTSKSSLQRQEENFLTVKTHVYVYENSTVLGDDTIISVTYSGEQEVWDITTKEHHTFLANDIAVHNCQNMDPDIIPELLYVQTMSKTPSTIYAGTALSVDTLLEEKWAESSQGMWHVRAGDGVHWLNMYDKDVLLKVCDNPQGPTCPYTGKRLNVTDGCYIHGNRQALAAGDVGIHVPQCIIPDIAYDPVQWGKVYRRIKRDDFKKVLQECFGIAVAEGSREISENDLLRLCVITDTKEQLMEKCRSGYYRLIISGCDWGGSDYNQAIKSKTSYTVHCIIGVAPDGGIDILHWRRHSGMNYPEIAQIIINEHNAWGAQAIASDFGVGMAYNMEIRNSIPFDKHFIMGYVGPMSAPLAEPKGQHMPNQLSLNRTEALTNVFKDIKSPILKIRCRNWDDMSSFLTDFLNMYRLPIEMPGGSNTFKYVRSSTKADDGLHAFTFAYVLAKFYLGEPLVRDEALERRLRNVLYAPAAAANSELANSVFGIPNYVVSG